MEVDDIISYHDLVTEERAALQILLADVEPNG